VDGVLESEILVGGINQIIIDETGNLNFLRISTSSDIASSSYLYKYSKEGERLFSRESRYCLGIYVDIKGFIYFSSTGGSVLKISPENEVLWTFSRPGNSLTFKAIIVNHERYIYAVQADQGSGGDVFVLNSEGLLISVQSLRYNEGLREYSKLLLGVGNNMFADKGNLIRKFNQGLTVAEYTKSSDVKLLNVRDKLIYLSDSNSLTVLRDNCKTEKIAILKERGEN